MSNLSMTWKETIQHFAAESNISEPLTQKIISLTGFLEEYLSHHQLDDLKTLSSELPQYSAKAFEEDGGSSQKELKKTIADLKLDQITDLLRLTTIFFHLVNSLEQHEIIRINRERSKTIDIENPRSESIADALRYFKEKEMSYEEALELFKKLDIQPT